MALSDLDFLSPGRRTSVLEVHHEPFPIRVPVHILVGRPSGPRLAVVGGVHGDEYDGIRAAQRLPDVYAPENLDGILVVIPVANPSAFAAGQRRTAIDDVDLNRSFPGQSDGGVSQRLAHALTETVLRHMDLVFTLHGGSAPMRLTPYLEFFDAAGETSARAYAAAVASGIPNLIAIPPDSEDSTLKGCLLPALGGLGVPVIEGEVGGRGELRAANADYYLERVAAVMGCLGLIASPARLEGASTHRVAEIRDVLSPSSGVLQCDVDLNQPVTKGQRLAGVIDIEGREISEITAPCDGWVGGYRGHSWIQTGQVAIRVFVPVTGRS
jgi:predicted deacylase